jgi:hypothetical protein
VQTCQSAARAFGVPSQQLLTESKIFKDQILSGTERTDNPSQEMPDRRDDGQDHARILSKHASSRFLQIIHSAGARGFDEGQLDVARNEHIENFRRLVHRACLMLLLKQLSDAKC